MKPEAPDTYTWIEQEKPAHFSLRVERPLDLAKTHEIALLREAVKANPASIDLRLRLAKRLFVQDVFDEAIPLFETLLSETADANIAWHLAEAYITCETPENDRASERCARLSLEGSTTREQRAGSLATLGKALIRQGRLAEAREALEKALIEDPHDRNAFKRLASLHAQVGADADTVGLADRLIELGVGHSRLLGAQAVALARMGRVDDAREAYGLDRYLVRHALVSPEHQGSMERLNEAVRVELARHPDLRFDRYGTASSKTWRIDEPSFVDSMSIPELQALICQVVVDNVKTLAAYDTPWTNARPARAVLHNWVVLTDAEGHEEWHVHQNGWLSGVYYIDVPSAVRNGTGRAGCIAFGLPEELVGVEAAAEFGETLIRPQPGMLMLFPSHCYHRTFEHGCPERRICLAFDIQPG